MSSGATSLNRKRTHSLERGGERPGSDISAKKPRTEASSNRSAKKKRGKKRTVSVVEDIAGSARSHNDGAEPMTPGVQRRGGHRRKPRRVVESDEEEDADIVLESTPHSQMTEKSPINAASTSSSPPLKGKEREVDPVPFVSISSSEDLSKETEDLNQRLDAQTTKLAIQSALISSFKDSLTCQICVDLMHKPFTLAPCGHIACYSCLVGWFKSNVAEDEFGPPLVHRKKTCPHCRSAVRDRPIENFTIKEMVNSLVNSGVLEDVPEDAIAVNSTPTASADPWASIFPKHPVRENNYDGLPFPLFDEGEDEDHGYDEGDMGIYDEEDDVHRCRGCMNEVVDGFCTLCERQYQPTWAAVPLLGGFFGGYGGDLWDDGIDSDSDEEEAYSQEGYEESFIDDDLGVGDGPGPGDHAPILPDFFEEDEEDDDDAIELDSPAVAYQRNHQAPIVVTSDEEDNDDYADADAHGDYGRFWNEEDEDGDYHDARSDSDDRGNDGYWSDEGPHVDDVDIYAYM